MASLKDILWFKTQFSGKIAPALAGTPFDVDMLTALACQETGELWGQMRHDPALSVDQIVALCCGDMLDDTAGRTAFPRNKEDLLAAPHGQEMFDIARKALVDMAGHVAGYGYALTHPRKFSHGFGVFQYDLQFFLVNPDYFLEKRYEVFENTLNHALGELKTGLKKRGLQGKPSITDAQFCEVAICYNTGGYNPSKGLKQGHSDNGKFYGEFIRDYLAMARQVVAVAGVAVAEPVVAPDPGTALLPPDALAVAQGEWFEVDTATTPLRLRSAPKISTPPTANVMAEMPDGHLVRSVTGIPEKDFVEVETTLGGRLFRGFAATRYLIPAAAPAIGSAVVGGAVAAVAASPAVPEAHLTPAPGSITKRTAEATAHSLNEAAMPQRTASDPVGLRDELATIIDYLATDTPAHKRYQPRDGLTFCNIYAHDYCALAKVYLPRVWWSQKALMNIAAGKAVVAKIGGTVDEVRANDLFRWLRDFGPGFGWVRATSVDQLQDHANMGGVCLIVARRKEDGKSGHIVAVVPETADEVARRDAAGHVTMPLQSQAGSVNFRYGLSTLNWWNDARFAESAFWMHA